MSTVEGDRHHRLHHRPHMIEGKPAARLRTFTTPLSTYRRLLLLKFSQIYGRLALLTASFLQENSTRLSSPLSMAKRFSSLRRRSPVDRCAFPPPLLSLLNSHLPVSLSLKYVPFLVLLYLVRKAHTPLIVLYVKYARRQPSQVRSFL